MPATDDIEEVANNGARWRSDNADRARIRRQRPLARCVEKAFAFEALLELFKGKLQRARPDGFHGFGDELELAALFVNADATANKDVQAVFWPKTEQHGLAAKEHDGKLSVGVLKREVDMAGWSGTEV